MKKRVRAIIFDGDNIILLRRVTKDREYWVFPGGMVEKGESVKDALARECKEELGIDVKVGKLLIKKDLDLYEEKQQEYFYFGEKTGGTLGTGEGPEYQEHNGYWGTHEPISLPKEKIKEIDLLPEEVKKLILEAI
ncbi:MAG: NUDIX domain-containing protein [Candidatus Moraniibacteriota bacterium]